MNERPPLFQEHPKNRVVIENLKNSRGQIGNQGFTREGVENILQFVTQKSFSEKASLREVLDEVKSSPVLLEKVKEFLEKHPIKITVLPDGTTHLEDGHHRAFLADQIGLTSLPTE